MRRSWALALVFASAACATAPPRVEPDIGLSLPEHWSARSTSPGAQDIEWWESFQDPSLAAVVEESLASNHDIRAASARLEQAAAQARIAGAELLPQAGFNLSGSRQRQNFIGLPIPGAGGGVLSRTFTSLGVSIDTTWEADLWGGLRAGKKVALAEQQAAQANLAGAWLSIAGQTARAWFTATEAQQQVLLARSTVQSYERNEQSVRARFERGLVPSLDLRLVLTELAGARALLEIRREQHDRAVRQLEILLGRYPGGELPVGEQLPEVPGDIPVSLPADLLIRRPDLIAAERRLAASEARVDEARALLYPRLSLTAGGGTASQELKDLLDGDFRVWNLAANIFQPIFQGGRLRAGVALADARAREAIEGYANALLDALGEVESALAAESYLAGSERELAVSEEQAAAAQELAQSRYAAGLENIITLLTAQRRFLEAQSARLAVRRQRLNVRVDLILAMGGGLRAGENPLDAGEVPRASSEEQDGRLGS